MAKVPKHRRIKRATVLIKRTRCIKNSKKVIKAPSLLYQKLKVNNHSLAKALAQERQEYRMLFTRNNELLAEVQDLAHACNKRDLVISNILKNSKEMMQMLVTMSGFLTNVISSCQEFVSNQVPRRTSSSSNAGRRESTRRTSMKSPARGVVKPMVSGHTITKPTINLSRVNMQRLPNSNLSIIEEPSTPERNSDRSIPENRRSRSLSERIPGPALSNENEDDRAMLRRRSNRYSAGRLSSGRYSKKNSGRLSGGSVVVGRLSRELLKSPRVTLQDVSRYLTNNQSINVRLFSETANSNNANSSSSPENMQQSEPSSPEENDQANMVIVQNDSEPQNTSESETENTPVQQSLPRKSTMKSVESKCAPKRSVRFENRSSTSYDSDDPLEGPSWLFDSTVTEEDTDNDARNNREKNTSRSKSNRHSSANMEQNSPVSSLSSRRRSSGNFRVPELPKRFIKPAVSSQLNLNNDFDLSNTRDGIGLETSSSYANHNGNLINRNGEDDEEDDEDEDYDRRRNLCFITQRRGHMNDDEDDEDDDTMLINMQRQMRPHAQASFQQPQQHQSPEQSERMQFDLNELLQLTPLKPLLKINCTTNNELVQPDPEAEPTVTVQLTQRVPPVLEETLTMSRMSTEKIQQSVARNQDSRASGSNGQEPRRFSELSTSRLSTRIELPRLTEFQNTIVVENNQQPNVILPSDVTDNSSNMMEKRKRNVRKQYTEVRHLASEEEEEEEEEAETPKKKKKKPKKGKKNSDNKDPSSAKVVLQKLNNSKRSASKSEHKNSDESLSSARSSVISRVDPSSDSECSSTSNNSRMTSARPRRQKAPKNLQEPNIKMKLRR
ncbi:CAR1 transcription factor [Copidosoma floridanum]|uniref:CAR1 transcription factor n=1 Tax=Copidosoma floridanum TaxID=29053 RepID=UPI0006C9CB23|nr:CAR1 transcription factor [Copidosoma floridanum]XP_014218155.1 CAR1 transcription factor [Copidosoma floridanum]